MEGVMAKKIALIRANAWNAGREYGESEGFKTGLKFGLFVGLFPALLIGVAWALWG